MKKRLIAFILLCTMIAGNIQVPAFAKTLSLSYNGKTVKYTGKQIKVTCDGSNVALSKTPGIMMGSAGYAMLPYYETFVKSKIKASKQYSSSTKQLILTYKSNSLKMKVNSRTAYLNGRSIKLPIAPVMVTYKDSGITRILVPSRSVASYLNIPYSWNSARSTVAISSNNKGSASVSGSTATSSASPTSYIYSGKTYKLSKRNVVYDGSSVNLSSAPACVIGGYNMVPYYDTFVKNGPKVGRSYSSKTKTLVLTSTVSGNKNRLTMKVNSKTADLNGKKITLPKAPVFLKFSKNGSSVIYVPAKAIGPLLGFNYSYSSSNKTISYTPGLSIKMGSSYSVYTRTRVAVKSNDKAVATAIPGILVDNTTLIPVAATFNKKYGLDVTYSYSNKKATFKRGNITVTMTMNSSKAKVGTSTKTMPVAARLIYLPASDKTYVMVPGQFVTEALGLKYRYSSGVSYVDLPNPVDNDISNNDNTGNNSIGNGNSNAGGGNSPDISNNDKFQATIQLNRPSDVARGSIVCTDDYNNKRLVISMPGDRRSYYSDNRPSLPGGVTFSTSYTGGKTELYFKTSVINGFRVQEDSGKIYIQNGKPTSMFKNVIVLDAGHGGSDSGATGNGYKEKDFTLSIVKGAKKHFDTDSNYKVYYTRLADTYPSLTARSALANEVEADLFLSVHINSYNKTSAGTETLYNPKRNLKNPAGLNCLKLATYVQQYVRSSTGFTNRGLKERTDLSVLNRNQVPAALVEIGFITNPTEAKKMAANLDNYGKAVYDSIVYAASQYPTNR